ncbi:DUF488 domain-containing protein [Gallibacterium melopsittaci]|uniref:DUF488 domain-containing protein n=1 Tax=Gallibacterium melopsittaci TaxID=516063 RepID=A0ABV6HZI4_9PAST
MYQLQIKRIYQPIEANDGLRILVDRLWPRGIKKQQAQISLWAKTIAPSPELRKWFNHQPENFSLFAEQYQQQLAINPKASEFVLFCQQQLYQHNITLLYAAKDPTCNHAIILQQWLLNQIHTN